MLLGLGFFFNLLTANCIGCLLVLVLEETLGNRSLFALARHGFPDFYQILLHLSFPKKDKSLSTQRKVNIQYSFSFCCLFAEKDENCMVPIYTGHTYFLFVLCSFTNNF